MADLLIGQTLRFDGDALRDGPDVASHSARGGVLIEAGRIAAVGEADDLRRDHPQATVHD